MLRRRQIDFGAAAPRLRSTVATATGPVRDVAWAVEERLVWRGADVLKGILDAVKWPFERLAWTLERRLVWPLQERSGEWSAPRRAAGAAAVALAAVGVGAASLLMLASGNGGHATAARTAAVRVAAAAPQPGPVAPAAPTLHGAPPVFAPAPQKGVKAPAAHAHGPAAAHAAAAAKPAEAPSATTSAAPGEIAGPAAITTARRFSGAFVRYETGQADAEVRSAFRATATPQLAASLLHRPPRLPADVEVPQAKVLNVVPGPQLGDDATVSVSLLRVGITSELRLSMHRAKSGVWQIKDVLG